MSDGCECRSPRWGKANSTIPNPLAGFEGPLRGQRKREKWKNGRGKRKGLRGRGCGVLVFCETPTPTLRHIVRHNDCVLMDDLREILNSSNKKCTIV